MVKFHLNNLAKVCIHELHYEVDVREFVDRLLRRERIEKRDDVLVVDQLHDAQLAVSSFGVRCILERSAQLLDGHVLLEYFVVGRAHNALGAGADRAQILVALEHAERTVLSDFDVVEFVVGLVADVGAEGHQ